MLEDSRATFEFLRNLVARRQLDADLPLCGRFFGAWTPAHGDALQRNAALLAERRRARGLPERTREEVQREFGGGAGGTG